MSRVRVLGDDPIEGFVVAAEFRDGRWLYKVSLPDDDPARPGETFDCWYAEEALESAL